MSVNDWMSKWEQERAQRKAVAEQNRKDLHGHLVKLGVEIVTSEYDGCGDSGQIEGVEFQGGDPNAKDTTVMIQRWQSSEVGTVRSPVRLADAVMDIFYEFLEAEHGGWENNDGAEGHFVWTIEGDTIEWEHRARYTEFDVTSHTL